MIASTVMSLMLIARPPMSSVVKCDVALPSALPTLL
jgi:hypothetical protein